MQPSSREHSFWVDALPAGELAKYGWASQIVAEEFDAGLARWMSPEFVQQRYERFTLRQDPVYARILAGLDDEPLARTFVSYWMIGQTIASQSRHWLEVALARILLEQARRGERQIEYVYAPSLVGNEALDKPLSLDSLGELRAEGAIRASWSVEVQRSCLEAIDLLVGRQQRSAPDHLRYSRESEDVQQPSIMAARARDEQMLSGIARALEGPPTEALALRCSLVIIEPDTLDERPHAWALRLVNPKSLARQAERKEERINLLRVFAYLLQEKVFRTPSGVVACVAELVPRRSGARWSAAKPDYFSDLTYWQSWRLWQFLQVPFDAVARGIEHAGRNLGSQMRSSLRGVLPAGQVDDET